MEYGTPADYLKGKVERGREDLADARAQYGQGNYRLSLIRSYYGVFHIVSATLFSMGIERVKHSGVEAAFLQRLIKPGLIDKEHGETFRQARSGVKMPIIRSGPLLTRRCL